MSAQRYERIAAQEDNEELHSINTNLHPTTYPSSQIPASPPPSFRSRASSIASRHQSAHDRQPLVSDADRTLAETFDSPSDDESDDDHSTNHLDDRQRVMSGRPTDEMSIASVPETNARPVAERRVTQLPVFAPLTSTVARRQGYDGVFANMAAKPERGEELDEKPPTYEQAAADAAPPYWETTILAPGGHNPDDVFIDGLPVGSVFSFVWNGMISMSFQLVGFLLTYLLHTTHAARNGSKAGLGITLVQFGFSLKAGGRSSGGGATPSLPGQGAGNGEFIPTPSEPNNHDFDPSVPIPPGDGGSPVGAIDPVVGVGGGMAPGDWFAYALMIVGWFILIKAVSDYLKARRHEQLVLQSPTRGLNVPIVAVGERPETTV